MIDLQPEDEAVYFCAVGAGDMEQGPEMQRERREEREPAAPASQAP